MPETIHLEKPLNQLPEDRISVNLRKSIIIDMKEKGYSAKEIAKITGYTENSVDAIYSVIRKKKNAFELMRPSALRSIRKFVKGEAVGAVIPTGSNVTASIGMILERTDPVINQVNHDIKITVDRSCLNKPVDNSMSLSVDNPIIDVSP
jgi:hypothetical protein